MLLPNTPTPSPSPVKREGLKESLFPSPFYRSAPLKFVVLLLLFVAAVLVYQHALPVLEGNDELWHYNYVSWLRLTWRLPDRATPHTNPMRQETGQAPLRYWLDAVIFDALGLPTQGLDGG